MVDDFWRGYVMRLCGAVALLASFFIATSSSAVVAETRLALIITNGYYTGGVLSPLTSPHKDGEILKVALNNVKFEVTHVRDATKREMDFAIQTFALELKRAGRDAVGFFYFSGHGASDGRQRNWLIPIGEKIADVNELPILAKGVNDVQELMSSSGAKTSFVVIDACRDIAFLGRKNVVKGFAAQPVLSGLFIAFATRPGQTAADENFYSTALAEAMQEPGLSANEVFERAKKLVVFRSTSAQLPVFENLLPEEFIFAEAVSQQSIGAEWDNLKSASDPYDIASFLKRYPTAPEAKQARERLRRLVRENSDISELKSVQKVLPGSEEALLAQRRLQELEKRAWDKAATVGTLNSFEEYLAAFPDGPRAPDARRKIQELKSASFAPPLVAPTTTGALPQLPSGSTLGNGTAPCERFRGQYYGVTGVDSNDVLNMRAQPSPSASVLSEIPFNAKGLGLGRCTETNWGKWCEIQYNCQTGWAHSKYLALEPEQGSQAPKIKYARVVGVAANDKLNIRRSAGDLTIMLGTIPPGARNVEIVECERYDGSSKTWCYIVYDGTQGWVNGQYLEVLKD